MLGNNLHDIFMLKGQTKNCHSSSTVLDKHSYLLFTKYLIAIVYKIFNRRMKIDRCLYIY